MAQIAKADCIGRFTICNNKILDEMGKLLTKHAYF